KPRLQMRATRRAWLASILAILFLIALGVSPASAGRPRGGRRPGLNGPPPNPGCRAPGPAPAAGLDVALQPALGGLSFDFPTAAVQGPGAGAIWYVGRA